jgi:hypothetical protein
MVTLSDKRLFLPITLCHVGIGPEISQSVKDIYAAAKV